MELPTPKDIEVRAAQAGIRINEVCRRAGLYGSLFSDWKSGRRDIKLSQLQRLLDATKPNGVEE